MPKEQDKSRPVILCVDDEPIVLDSLKEQLRRQFDRQFHIEVAQDSSEALEIIDEVSRSGRDLPVLISDHIMPGMKGDALLIAIHRQLPRTRKILLTGQAGVDAVGNLVNESALYRYIAKPWAREDLGLTIKEAVRSYYQEREVERQHAELRASHDAGRRFVPFEFLRLLGRERLAEVSLDDHVEQRLSVFFSDIQSYTPLAEGKSPKQIYDFVNEYLSYMEPAIREEGGFVDKFTGDGVMALFEEQPERAIRAGLASQKALERFNEALHTRGEPPIRIGIGINTGPLMLGIIGSGERLNAGVLGDPVNVAARLESLSRQVGANLLISESTVQGLTHPDSFELRTIGRFRLKGKSRPVRVFEVLDALPREERGRRLLTRRDVEDGQTLLEAGVPDQALLRFEAARCVDPQDPLIADCLARCRGLLHRGTSSSWDGVVNLDVK